MSESKKPIECDQWMGLNYSFVLFRHSSDLQALKIEKSTLEDTLKRESLAHEEELHKIKNAFSERLISLESNYHTMQTSYEKVSNVLCSKP